MRLSTMSEKEGHTLESQSETQRSNGRESLAGVEGLKGEPRKDDNQYVKSPPTGCITFYLDARPNFSRQCVLIWLH